MKIVKPAQTIKSAKMIEPTKTAEAASKEAASKEKAMKPESPESPKKAKKPMKSSNLRRLARLTAGDICFQWKYGFYLLYAVFTIVYLLVLAAIPTSARRVVAAIMIYTDPAAMGLFFMGAIILLEKSQRVNCALAASPIRTGEYMLAKLLSLALIGLLVGGILAAAGGVGNWLQCLAGIVPTSLLCSACGLIAAVRSRTLNQFVLLAVPFELFLCLPPVLLLFGYTSPWLLLHPGVAAVWLIYGDAPTAALCLLSLAVWCVPTLWLCRKSVDHYFAAAGGEA